MHGLFLEIVEYIANTLLGVFQMDLAYFERSVPVAQDIFRVILAVGWALLLGNLVFQAMRSMVAGLGFEGEDPQLLFTRTFLFSFLLLASRQICNIGLGISATVIEMLQVPSSIQIPSPEETAFSIGASWLLVVIVSCIILWQVVRLFFEVGERYVVTAVLTILSPLAFAMGGSKSTEDIFKGWVRMFGSMCLMMVLNVVCLKLLLSALEIMPSGLEMLPWTVLIMGIARVTRKIDGIVTRIGLNPAMTGDGLGRSMPGILAFGIARSLGSTVVKTIGRNGGQASSTGGSHGFRGSAPGAAGTGSRFYGRQASGGTRAQDGFAASATHTTQENQTATASSTVSGTAGTAKAAASQMAAGERAATAFNSAAQSDPSSTPQPDASPSAAQNTRRTSVPPQGGQRPHSPFGTAAPGTSGTARSGDPSGRTIRHSAAWSASPQRAPSGVQSRDNSPAPTGMAGTGTAGEAARPETTRFTAVPPTARQEPRHTSGNTASRVERQTSTQAKAQTNTQRHSAEERHNTTRSTVTASTSQQSHVQPSRPPSPPGMAGIPASDTANRPTQGAQPVSGPGRSSVTPPPAPARQESKLPLGTGAVNRGVQSRPGTAGSGQASVPTDRVVRGGQAPSIKGSGTDRPASGRPPAAKDRPHPDRRGGGNRGR